jgi:hypothetical protein
VSFALTLFLTPVPNRIADLIRETVDSAVLGSCNPWLPDRAEFTLLLDEFGDQSGPTRLM